jgi:hypothetical protein
MTLPELLVALLILAIVGTAMVRLLLGESRSVDRLILQRSARGVTRSSVNLLLSELRMVVPRGVIAATPASLELLAPYALGISCGKVGTTTVLSVLPVDSAMVANALFSGYAWRGQAGDFAFVDSGASSGTASAAACTAASIVTMPGGRVVSVSPALPDTALPGTPVFLLQRLRYWFGPSSDLPGAVALLRTRPLDGTTEELASPFDSTSRFRFFHVGIDTSLAAAPAVYDDLRGIELVLTGLSTRTGFRSTKPERSVQRTSVYFTNSGR